MALTVQAEEFIGGIQQTLQMNPNEPPRSVVAYWGYLGPAVWHPGPAPAPTDDDRWRLYFNLHLTEYVEFRLGDLVFEKAVTPGPNSRLPGHVVWLREDARVQFVQVATVSQQAGFLRGPISGIPAQSAAPSQGVTVVAANSAGCGSLACGE